MARACPRCRTNGADDPKTGLCEECCYEEDSLNAQSEESESDG